MDDISALSPVYIERWLFARSQCKPVLERTMAESLFDIFGDQLKQQTLKNVRQPLANVGNENMGKVILSGPIKPNEPIQPMKKKQSETKKSFLSNAGKALQGTPVRQAFTPRAVNVGSLIYSDADSKGTKDFVLEELEFTKPRNVFDNYHTDFLDYLPGADLQPLKEESPPNTPPPSTRQHSMEFNCSYQDEFFTDDFSVDSFADDEDLKLPELY